MTAKPPKHLGPEGKRFFRKVCAEFSFGGDTDLEIVTQMSGCMDRLSEARAMITKLGIVIVNPTTKIVKPNPAVNIERDNRILLARLARELGMFTAGGSDDPRPPRATNKARRF